MRSKLIHSIIILVVVSLGFVLGISFTSSTEALVSDAQDYTILASQLSKSDTFVNDIFSPQTSQFIDSGYAIFLSFIMQLFPKDYLMLAQLANYLLWGFSTIFIYLSLSKLVDNKKAKKFSLLMALSPVFLTFPAKLYSESLAAFGVSVIIYSLTKLKKSGSIPLLFLGSIILVITKSVFLPLIIGVLFILVTRKKPIHAIAIVAALLLSLPILTSSMSGGRSRYTLAVQTAKLNMSFSENLACIPYNLSFPVGKFLFPKHQNTCIIFQSNPNLPRYEKNPVRIANKKYHSVESFTYIDAFEEVLHQPIKYTFVILVDVFNLVFVEGFYATVLLDMPLVLRIFLYAYGKMLSLWLWYQMCLAFTKLWKVNSFNAILLISPLLYFFFVVSHFHIEPRYFYPFLPWLYFVSALKDKKDIINNNGD